MGLPFPRRMPLRRVRTVMLLADDRDLREPDLGPEADAVRLMTVHASKGLQFEAVHVVGLHDDGFPKAPKSDQCQVPPGIGDGRDAKKAQAEEERCCFFVAISRAEDHLRLYHTLQAAKEDRVASPFIRDLGGFVAETLDGPPAAFPAPAAMSEPHRSPTSPSTTSVTSRNAHCAWPTATSFRSGAVVTRARSSGPEASSTR